MLLGTNEDIYEYHIIALYSCATHTAERRNALTKIKRPG